MGKIPISVCIIAKNEEKHMEECLKRVIPYGFEIVVVDTGSTDATMELAKKYTSKVYTYQWNNDFSAARNYAIAHATYPWILVLDCDEYLEQIDCRQLRLLMQKHLHHVGMLSIRNMQQQDDETKYHMDQVPRFFNRNFFHYEFRIHEQVTPIEKEPGKEIVLESFLLPMKVKHVGYCLSVQEMKEKQERNLAILQSALGEQENDDYLYFQMGQSYMVLHRLREAADAYEHCFAMHPNSQKEYMQVAICSYARVLLLLEEYEKGLAHIQTYEAEIATPEFLDLAGRIYCRNNMPLKALQIWLQLIHMPQREAIGEEEIYVVYVEIIKSFQMIGSMKWAEQFKQELIAYATAHGKQISFR